MNERIRLRKRVLNRPERDQYVLLIERNGAKLFKHLLVDDTTSEYLLLVEPEPYCFMYLMR